MYLTGLEIEDIKGIARLSLNLGNDNLPGWTVIAGQNGAGKTTLLQSIAIPFCPDLANPRTAWLRKTKQYAHAKVFLELNPEDYPFDEEPQNKELSCGLSPRSTFESVPDYLEPEAGDLPSGWFFAAYGPYRRLTNHAFEVSKLMSDPGLSRAVTLFREDASLAAAQDWLRDVEFRHLKANTSEEKRFYHKLKHTALSLLNDDLLPPGIEVVEINADGLWVRQAEEPFLLDQLSDGCRAVAGLVLDILRHMAHCFGYLATETKNNQITVTHSGVVLIDEVETHLHPSWQRRLGFWLIRHFPNIQFIVTTHSGYICQAAKPGGLFRLSKQGTETKIETVEEDDYYSIVNGTLDDAAVSKLFGLDFAHSDHAEHLKTRAAQLEFKLLEEGLSEKESDELALLNKQLPKGGSSNVERALRKLSGT